MANFTPIESGFSTESEFDYKTIPFFRLQSLLLKYKEEWGTSRFFQTRAEFGRSIKKNTSFEVVDKEDTYVAQYLKDTANEYERFDPLSLTEHLDPVKLLEKNTFKTFTGMLKMRQSSKETLDDEKTDIAATLKLLNMLSLEEVGNEFIPVFKDPDSEPPVFYNGKKTKLLH